MEEKLLLTTDQRKRLAIKASVIREITAMLQAGEKRTTSYDKVAAKYNLGRGAVVRMWLDYAKQKGIRVGLSPKMKADIVKDVAAYLRAGSKKMITYETVAQKYGVSRGVVCGIWLDWLKRHPVAIPEV